MQGKAVFITGASSGIGLATARRLDKLGFRVFAAYLPGEDTTALRQGASAQLSVIPLDITRGEMIEAAAATVGRAVGAAGLYGLVNNAGIAVTGPMEFVPLAALRQQFEVNYFGQVAVTQAFLPLLRPAPGRIVNLCSILGRVVTTLSGPYCASKFAMEAFSDSLRLELHPWGMYVSAVEPGVIRTPIWNKALENLNEMGAELPPNGQQLYSATFEAIRRSITRVPQNSSEPEEVAAAVAHALTAPRPRTRYLVGKEARQTAFLRWLLPDRVLDSLTRWRYG